MATSESSWRGESVVFDHPDPIVVAAQSVALKHLERSDEYGDAGDAERAREYAEAALRCAQTVATLNKPPR